LDQAEIDATLDEALVAPDEEIRTGDFPIRFDSTNDSAALHVFEESLCVLPRNSVVASSRPRRLGSVEEPHGHVAHEPSRNRAAALPWVCDPMRHLCLGRARGRGESSRSGLGEGGLHSRLGEGGDGGDSVGMKWGRRRRWKSIRASVKPSMRGGERGGCGIEVGASCASALDVGTRDFVVQI
jgi:hypothetical protein